MLARAGGGAGPRPRIVRHPTLSTTLSQRQACRTVSSVAIGGGSGAGNRMSIRLCLQSFLTSSWTTRVRFNKFHSSVPSKMPASKSVKLNTGAEMPTVGLGTWKSAPGAVEHAVEFALKNGYRSIDTAAAYKNETEVGVGMKASGVPRSEFFLTTKLDNPDHERAAEALEQSLKNLGTDYLDLWLMHWPAPMTPGSVAPVKTIDWLDTWKSMEKLYKAHPEKLRAIGVSNFSVEYLERLLANCEVVPAVNQIELHPSCPQQDVVDFCNAKGIVVTAYSPLGSDNSPLLQNEVVKKIAEKYNVQPANVLISLQANRPGVNVLPKSVTNARILSNSNIIDLTAEEVKELNDIDKTHHFRACHPSWTGWGSLGFPDCKDADK
ncbi:putative aldo/keto reductase family protein [Lyophyllum shimeji]|uniref:Aldo/keto reductase family protein n=1 Tax=Lyophyllum shimeji TaxID=47721 RepID=A0A9P3UR58_LYOSH|nr:putative aldo/keto reductase family protein [Lyophyllum shimeji]